MKLTPLLDRLMCQAQQVGDYLYFRCSRHGFMRNASGISMTDGCEECEGIAHLYRTVLAQYKGAARDMDSVIKSVSDACQLERAGRWDLQLPDFTRVRPQFEKVPEEREFLPPSELPGGLR